VARIISLVVGIAVAFWSLLSLGSYLVVNVVGGSLSRHADSLFAQPETVVFMADLFRFFTTLGLGAVVVVWALGTAALLATGWIARRLAA
jgi:hypothetical protein